THAARIVQRHGEPLAAPDGSLTHVFPTADALAEADDDVLAMPERRKATLRGVSAAVRDGVVDLDAGADRERTRRNLLALPGIGTWTVEYVAMRALGDPDAFPAGDLGVRHGLRALGVEADAREAERRSQAWRPFRAYTVLHLWGAH
ncbi:MAG: DNA-3-methyladenine glycosylase, partial [Actinomycetota bacterium]|nr:DNA-3-methyladenine glycosylase [Actinomycetota bacterium]